ncbi:sugar phosphate isomerase/epimerase family protein [Rubinisphaera italica]|uniref:Xylose isomerase-like TIM barrel n=1 Tax=Rubinisphaera italica TaxID=2527969 RepID=A0A5C5XHY5_9PLAN|nr:sugar phosphate isomerase/epimerase family protein [Rubinisphaera italica]TWT62717.1 Xylose isomerase-like TIM barrel [Rubinisphaera italica]
MNAPFSRRSFLATSATAAGLFLTNPALAIEPFARKEPGPMKLSLAAYSFRKELTAQKGKPAEMTLFDLVDYCRDQDVPGVELTSYYFPTDFDDAYLLDLKQHCHTAGISISGGAIRNDFCVEPAKLQSQLDEVEKWIKAYATLGAPAIRIFAGKVQKGSTTEEAIQRCATACNTACEIAAQHGIFLALENHGGITASPEDMLKIVKQVESPWFGVNFDSGNFRNFGNVYAELAKIAPYAVNAQVKVEIWQNDRKVPADLSKIVNVLKEANYGGWVALEYEAAEPPKEAIPVWLIQLKTLL